MNQSLLFLFFLGLLFNPSLQNQLFRDLAGTTLQNFEAQANQWTMGDPLGLSWPISTSECFGDIILIKPDSYLPGTYFKKTFNNLESHNLLRFYVQIYYMGDYSSQTVNILFDSTSIDTSQVLPMFEPQPDACAYPYVLSGYMVYYGAVPHNTSSVTVEFVTNLHGAIMDVTWGLRNFSFVTEISDTINSPGISAGSYYSIPTVPTYPCPFGNYILDNGGGPALCVLCSYPCAECFGSAGDQCFIYAPESPENRLCPLGQTYLAAGCTNCTVENCDYCDVDVSQCDTCLNTCGLCDTFSGPFPQCQQCTVESNLVLYQGACIESCPQGMYADSSNICQNCQIGCLECSGSDQCSQCASGTTNTGGLCICNDSGKYFENSSGGCTGSCLLGCEQCISGEACLICASGMTVQSKGDCRCDTDGFYYQDTTGSCTGQCSDSCNYCHDSSSCISCSGNRIPKDGMCQCQSPRILIGTSCECPSFMEDDPITLSCSGIDIVDIVYQSTISPLYDGILQIRMNPITKWSNPPSFTWTVSCNFQNPDTQNDFLSYISTQNTDLLLLPSSLLEYELGCIVSGTYLSGTLIQSLPMILFNTVSPAQPQLQIVGSPLQMIYNSEQNFIFAQVKSSIGSLISVSDLEITWTQTSGDNIDISLLLDSSNPLQLTIPKCTLVKGKLYKFRLDVSLLINPGSAAWQEVTIAVYAQKFQAQIVGQTDNYHLSSQPLTLNSQLSFQQDDNGCTQTNSLSDLLDLSSAMYTWECFYLNLELSPTRLLTNESELITNDPGVYPHPDPNNLFYQSTSSSTLTIPSSYFTDYSTYQFMFYLTVTVQNQDQTPSIESFTVIKPTLEILKTKIHLAIVLTKPFTTVSFTCKSENNCQAYSPDSPVHFVGSNFNYQYSYNWNLTQLQSLQYTTFFRVVDSYYLQDYTIVPQILYTISDGTNSASAFFTLPPNPPPQNGQINAYPLIGEAYNTKFSLSTYAWTDTDLPVYYQFYTTTDSFDSPPNRNLMIRTLNPYDETILLPYPFYTYAYVGALVQDNLKSTSYSAVGLIFLSNCPQSFCEVVGNSTQALSSSQKLDNIFQRFRLVTVMMRSLALWEQGADSECMNDSYDFKFAAITEVKEIVEALYSRQEFKVQLLNNIVYSANPEYNQDKNWNLYDNIIDSYYLPNISQAILPAEEYNPLMTWTDYQIWYMKKPNSTNQNPAKIFTYINMILRSTLINALPVDEAITYQGSFYNSFTYKTTYCKVLQEYSSVPYGFFGLQVNVTLRPGQQIPPEDCNNLVDMIFLAFRSNYTITDYSLSAQNALMNIVYFDLLDSLTGKSLLDLYTFLLLSPNFTCPVDYSCQPTGDGGTQIYGVFDLRDQINKIFAKSNIDQIQNISALAHFRFWKSVAFWTVIAFSICFLLSFYWLYLKHPAYCALTSKKNTIAKAPLVRKIHLFFWVIHPLVGIYVYNDLKTTKPIKLAIYYQRLVVVMVFSTIFSSLDTGEGWVFKGYILLFNAATVTPVSAILGRIFEWAFKTNNSKKKKIPPTISLFIAIFSYLVLLVACFLVMFIIEAQQDSSQNKTWAFNFVISFVQDLSLSPALSAIYKVLLIRFSVTERVAKKIKSPKIKNYILSDDFKSIYDTIFAAPTILTVKDSVKDGGLSPRSTLMSPISSTRKFLKFTTMDLQSPQTTKNNTHFDFRTRIASENEIDGPVDLVPMETLIGNRFQTLFPEAKAETVRTTSPPKQNFEKMQTTNIYSKDSLTHFPTFATTLKGSILKQSKPFKTIEFNTKEPVEMTLDDIFQFAEQPNEGEEIAQTSQLKLFKSNSKATESPLRGKKKQAPVLSYLPSVELSLEQRASEKASAVIKKKGILKQSEATLKPFQLMDLSSMNQFKEPSAIHPDELSSFDGHPEETFVSQLKLLKKNNSKATASSDREKRKDLIEGAKKIAVADLSSGDLPSISKKMARKYKEKDTMPDKLAPSMEFSSVLQFKEPVGFRPDEFSSFDENMEESPVSLPKFKTVESIKKKKDKKVENQND